MNNYDTESEGRWVTINGAKVFIEKGQSVTDAFKSRKKALKISRNLLNKTESALIKKEMNHLGRWAELDMKDTGEKIRTVRTGYGSMEYPERDPHEVWSVKGKKEQKIAELNTLSEVAEYLIHRRYDRKGN